jgi:hypothetical protein
MPEKPTVFVAMSYDNNDKIVNKFITDIFAIRFTFLPADIVSAEIPPTRIPGLIGEADIFIAIATRREKIEKKDAWVPPGWIQNEIGMAHARGKRILVFKEKGVELGGIENYITTVGEFDRSYLENSVQMFMKCAEDEARALNVEKIRKIEGWDDTKKVITEILEGSRRFIHGIVEDFTSIDKFENILASMNRGVEFLLICSPSGDDISNLENRVSQLDLTRKEIRFIDPSKIGRVRILFNERTGLFVIHSQGEDYFGIKISPINDLESHFEILKAQSIPDREAAKLEGKFCPTSEEELVSSIMWAIKAIGEFPEKDRFIYFLARRFTLFARNKELRQSVLDIAQRAREMKCEIRFVLGEEALDRGGYPKSLSEMITETLRNFNNVSVGILEADYYLGRRRMIITNKIALDILDFDTDGYYYSAIQDSNHISMLKQDFEALPIRKAETGARRSKPKSVE